MSNSRYYQRKKKPVATVEQATNYYYNADIYNCLGFTGVKLHYKQLKLLMVSLEHYSFLLHNCLDNSEHNKNITDEVFLTYHILFERYSLSNQKHSVSSICELSLSNSFKYHVA